MTDKRKPLRNSFLAVPMALSFLMSTIAMADESDWEYSADIYLWAPKMTAVTPGGREATLPFYKILDDLQMAFMGHTKAQKDKWSLSLDVIYVSLDQKLNRDLSYVGLPLDGNVSLKSWIVTPVAGYAIHDSEKARIEIIGGARYLWLKLDLNVTADDAPVFNESDSSGFWDAVIGARGIFALNDKWFVPTYFDIGTGATDRTWQGFVGIGYKFKKFTTEFGYRYMEYKFDSSNKALGELKMKGPLLGVRFDF